MKGIIPTEKWAIRMSSAIKEARKSEREELGTRMMARAGKAETAWKRGKHSARNRGGKICRCNEWRKHEEFFSLQKKKKELNWIVIRKEKDSKLTLHYNNEIPSRFLLIYLGSNHNPSAPKFKSYTFFRGSFCLVCVNKKFATTILHLHGVVLRWLT